jgi:hypothetical protein
MHAANHHHHGPTAGRSVLGARLHGSADVHDSMTYATKPWTTTNTFVFWTIHQRPRGATS